MDQSSDRLRSEDDDGDGGDGGDAYDDCDEIASTRESEVTVPKLVSSTPS